MCVGAYAPTHIHFSRILYERLSRQEFFIYGRFKDLFYELVPSEFHKIHPLFERMDEHLVLASILKGHTSAPIFVDQAADPKTAFTGFHARMFLLGSPDNPSFNQTLHTYLIDQAIPQAQAEGQGAFIFHLDSDAWLPQLDRILAGRYPLERKRQYYRCRPRRQDGSSLLPSDFQLRPVDSQLVQDTSLKNLNLLLEELCSERVSVEDFLVKSFGFVAQQGNELAGWCLSEYNDAGRCEVGVATLGDYQRRGLGTMTTLTLLDQAARLGYHQVGWHCWSDNLPSAALARRSGLKLIHESQVYVCLFDLGLQLALHGQYEHQSGNLDQALDWYERAKAAGCGVAWVLYNMACCQALKGDRSQALEALEQAIEAGFGPLATIQSEPELEALHGEPGWQKLFV